MSVPDFGELRVVCVTPEEHAALDRYINHCLEALAPVVLDEIADRDRRELGPKEPTR